MDTIIYEAFADELDKIAAKRPGKTLRGIPLSMRGGLGATKSLGQKAISPISQDRKTKVRELSDLQRKRGQEPYNINKRETGGK